MISFRLSSALLVAALATVAQAGLQSVGVQGKLFCGNVPAANVKVKLVDEDTGPNPDDLLDEGYTSSQGYFRLAGSEDDAMGDIDVRLKIYHNCLDGITLCDRRWAFNVPDHYITNNKEEPDKFMDIGRWNLELELESEERDCWNV